jgi:fumarate hydratase class II
LCINDEDQKECIHFGLIFCNPLNILHKSNALKGKKPKFATTKSKI